MTRAFRATVQGMGGAVARAHRDVALVVAYGLLVAAVTCGALGAPLVLGRAADEGLGAAVAAAQPGSDVVVEYHGDPETPYEDTDGGFVSGLTAAATSGVGGVVRDATGPPLTTLRTAPMPARTETGGFSVQLVHLPGADVTWTDGGPPGSRSGSGPGPVEIGLSRATAAVMGLEPGDTARLGSDLTARVAGIFEPGTPDDPAWSVAPEVLAPGPERPGVPVRSAAAFLSAASAGAVLEELSLGAARVEVRFRIAPERLRLDDAAALREAVVRIDTATFAAPDAGLPTTDTDLPEVLDSYTDRLAVARSQVATVLTGLTVASGLVLLLAARLLTSRRRADLELERARGASVASVALRVAAESVPVTLLAGAVAGAVTLPAGGPASGAGLVPAAVVLAVAAGAPAVLAARVATSSWSGRRSPANRRDRERAERAVRGWRAGAEAGVVVLAAGAVAAALRRGVVPGGDLYVNAAPLLLAGACTVVVLRGVPLLLRATHRAASRGRGVVPLVAASRAAGARARAWRADAAAPVLALTVTAALAVSCAAVAATVRDGQAHAAGAAVGAEARVDGPVGDLADRALAGGPGATAAAGTVLTGRTFVQGSGATVTLLVLDTEIFPQFAALSGNGSGAAVAGPGATGAGARAAAGAVPALVDPRLVRTARLVDPSVWVLTSTVPLDVVGTADVADTGPYPDLLTGAPDEPVVVVDRAALTAALGPDTDDLPVHTVWLEGPGASDLAEELADDGASSGTVTTRAAYQANLRGDPLASGLVTLHRAATGLFVLLGAAAVLLTGFATAAGRTRVLAVLRTLGVPRRSGRALAVAELAPVLAAAVATGLASGVLVAVLLTSAQGLGSLVGGGTPDLTVSWWPFVLVTVATVVAVAVAVVVEERARRDVRIGEALRAW